MRASGVERPVAAFADGSRLAAPAGFLEPAPVRTRHDPSTQAHRCGLHTRPAHELYDVVVIGAGPAGLTAAVYAASQALRFGAELLVRVEIARRDRIRTAASPWSSAGGGRLRGRSGVIATDVAYRRPDAPGVEALVGRGASYGSAPAQAPGHRDQDVVIVGGANSAKRPCT